MKKSKLTLFALALIAFSQNTMAFTQGDLIVRGGLAAANPNDSSSNIIVGGVDLGVDIDVGNDTQLGLTLAYFLTDKISIEILASTPFKHDVDFGVSDPLGTGNQLGEVTQLPPTVSLNYYLNKSASKFQPYIGVGLNYFITFDEEFTSANRDAGLQNLSLDESFGLAAQVGVDYLLTDKWFLNSAIRWIDVDTDATFTLDGIEGSVDSIEIDPLVYTVSIGYVF